MSQAQNHAEKVDQWLGLETHQIESFLTARLQKSFPPTSRRLLGDEQEDWVGLPVQSMQTPYAEIRSMLHELERIGLLSDDCTLMDLGAGYGRMAWVIGKHYPAIHFIGYEFVSERVTEARRCLLKWKFPKVSLQIADLSSAQFTLPPAQVYFIYDFGSREAIEKSLQDIRQVAQGRQVTVVGRGRSSRDAIERKHPWLSQVKVPRHFQNFSFYFSG